MRFLVFRCFFLSVKLSSDAFSSASSELYLSLLMRTVVFTDVFFIGAFFFFLLARAFFSATCASKCC